MAKRTKIVASMLVLILGLAGYIIYKKTAVPGNLLGGDRDIHGCIGSAGYSWCEIKNKCLRQWEEECAPLQSAAQEAVLRLFAVKYPKYANTLSVSVKQETQNFARGSVSLAAGAPGGIFLAARIDGVWQIVFDGNGQIPCSLSEYGFPGDMLADCAAVK